MIIGIVVVVAVLLVLLLVALRGVKEYERGVALCLEHRIWRLATSL